MKVQHKISHNKIIQKTYYIQQISDNLKSWVLETGNHKHSNMSSDI